MRHVVGEEKRLLTHLETLDPLRTMPADSEVLLAFHPYFPSVGGTPPQVAMDGCQVSGWSGGAFS